MAITIESANNALTRNGLGHLTMIKNADTGAIMLINAEKPEDVDAALIFKDDAGGTITRVRDLTITTVVARAKELDEHIKWRSVFRAKVNAESVDEGNIPVTSYSPVTAAEIAATGQQALSHTLHATLEIGSLLPGDVRVEVRSETAADYAADAKEYPAVSRELVANPAITIREKREQNEAFGKFGADRRNDNVAHVDNRSKARVYPPQLVGRAVRPVTADAEVAQRNRDELQQFAKEQNEAFISENLNLFSKSVCGFQILRSGDLRVGHAHTLDNRPCHTWKLRDLGMRFMRDKPPAWWMDNAVRLALGYVPEDAGPVMTEQRIRQHATNLQAIRDIANRSGRFAYLIVDDFGKSEAKQASDLRDAFNRINQGQRVFIHSADLKRYDRELKEGKHGQPRGALDL